MNIKTIFFGTLAVALIIAFISIIAFKPGTSETTLQLQIIDSVSKNWVWDFTAEFQDRYIKGYYQSDKGPVLFQFTHLTPGNWMLKLNAPSYEPVSVPVTIKRGKNKIEKPLEMSGYEIPGLADIFVYKEWVGDILILNPRPVDAEGLGIGNHPCLDMWFGLRVSVQVKNGVIIQKPIEKGSGRGEELFRGRCDWEWDPNPDTYYRYIIKFPHNKIKKHNAPYNVYDYLIIFPDPRKINKEELYNEMKKTLSISDEDELKLFLDSFKDKITYFISSSWNQPAQ